MLLKIKLEYLSAVFSRM